MDVSVFLLVVGLVAGLGLGVAAGLALGRGRQAGLISERDTARALAAESKAARERAQAELADLGERLRAADTEAARLAEALRGEKAAAAERIRYVEQSQQRLAEQFSTLSSQALEQNSRRFLDLADARLKEAGVKATGELEQRRQAVEHLVNPLKDTLAKVETQLRELEQARVTAYTALTEQVGFVQQTSEQLRTQTSALVTALRAPQARGQWGEMHLRRCVEIAGMVEHCDFDEQATATTEDGTIRPDMVIRLAGGKNVVVDAKVSLAAYLEAAETDDVDRRKDRLAAHARHLRVHVDGLSAKSYWASFSPTPEFVVLFVPGEAFLAPALEQDPSLLEYAMGKRVIIATPTTLVTMLRTVSYSWQQAALTENAREVFDLGRELYGRLGRLGEHVDKLGRSIGRVVGDYNTAVGSLESRVLVTARRLKDLKVVEGDLDAPKPVDQATRVLTAAELVAAAEESRPVRMLLPADDESAGDGDVDALDAQAAPRFGTGRS